MVIQTDWLGKSDELTVHKSLNPGFKRALPGWPFPRYIYLHSRNGLQWQEMQIEESANLSAEE